MGNKKEPKKKNIRLPDYSNIENKPYNETYKDKLDSFWDGETIDENKN